MENSLLTSRPRVVVVGDEHTVANKLAVALSQNGFAVLAVYSGSSALQVCHIANPDVLMIDVLMPSIDGIETAAKIRELCPDCRILLFTETDVRGCLRKLRTEGKGLEVVEKPLLPEQWVSIVREYATRVARLS